jgi:DeoR family transcriptional regulator, suf operon transcriptional repressor
LVLSRRIAGVLFEGDSQQIVLTQLLERKSGMTVDELVDSVGLSRSAVNQHLMALERNGHIRKTTARKTKGRPGRVYVLTEDGTNLFPKKYSWFSRTLLLALRKQVGDAALADFIYELGVDMSAVGIPRLIGKNRIERVDEIVKIMNETGFLARTVPAKDGDKLPRVECKNCVYHDLSREFTEVCRFDIGFLSGLMGAEVEHETCMQRGGESCRFRFKPPA